MSAEHNRKTIEGLEPKAAWEFFADFSAVPHPSKKEEKIRAWMRETADKLGLAHREDRVGNMVIDVPASPGCENAPTIVLQGHVDMVCEKNSGTEHDFDNDPIRFVKDTKDGKPIICADGTTLGADNGMGVALALAAATCPEVKHGPLELLCTIDEEMGMTGAKALAPDFFKGKILINLDTEDDDELCIGCAGGCDTTLSWSLPVNVPQGNFESAQVVVRGLQGGHSGCDIHLNRGNANRVLARVLRGAPSSTIQLAEFLGGSKRNAIPREAEATLIGPGGTIEALKQAASVIQAEIREVGIETKCEIEVAAVDAPTKVLSTSDSSRVLATVVALPCGVLATVPEIPGLVMTSNNVSLVTTGIEGELMSIEIACLSRSSSKPQLDDVIRKLHAAAQLAQAAAVSENEYPGWQPNVDSPVLKICRDIYEELFAEKPKVSAIHAGLECGIINEQMGGGLDTISFGPTINNPHSPDEYVVIDSVENSWKLLKAVLVKLAS